MVLLIHDFADIFLESAKMAHYAKLSTLCDCIFAFFTVRLDLELAIEVVSLIYPYRTKIAHVHKSEEKSKKNSGHVSLTGTWNFAILNI